MSHNGHLNSRTPASNWHLNGYMLKLTGRLIPKS